MTEQGEVDLCLSQDMNAKLELLLSLLICFFVHGAKIRPNQYIVISLTVVQYILISSS